MAREYGSMGRIGIGTPQANPTVEPEMAILLPRRCSLHVTRLTSRAASASERLMDYLLRVGDFLQAYDSMQLDAFGFACTGSSYLLGAQEEERLVRTAQDRIGCPFETAARAITWALRRMRAQRIGMVVAYPNELSEAASRYWLDAGLEIIHMERIPIASGDTRGIYDLGSESLGTALQAMPAAGIDAVLVSGTGLPSLSALRTRGGVPTISSNLCLAARILDLLGKADCLEPRSPFIRGWEARLEEALRPPP